MGTLVLKTGVMSENRIAVDHEWNIFQLYT
jgi:hypothetical protein